ncbi:MAG: ketol-acid reductoisomerase, partial [Candidatus Thorarchaeota archaeon]
MVKKIFTDDDGQLDVLSGLTVGVVGYGNQGRAQALNMRDSGLKIIIGNKKDEYKKIAENDGFD